MSSRLGAGAHAIGPSRTLIELTYASHDVLASHDADELASALSFLSTWLHRHQFADESPSAHPERASSCSCAT